MTIHLQRIPGFWKRFKQGETHKPCPFCGADPGLASFIRGAHIVGCEAEDCHANPQVADYDLSRAWAKWDGRDGA